MAEQVAEGARAREEEARASGRELAERARKAEALVAEYEADIGQVRWWSFRSADKKQTKSRQKVDKKQRGCRFEHQAVKKHGLAVGTCPDGDGGEGRFCLPSR